jgi:F420H(2)-dependent quinone reductase
MKQLFGVFVAIFTFLYRLSNGRIGGSVSGLPVLLLTTTGRKTGRVRTVPLGYIRDGDQYVIIASNGGQPRHPGWFFNVQSNAQVTLQIKEQRFKATAQVADPEARKRLWEDVTRQSPAYRRYETRTREIPLVILRVQE